MINFKAIGQNLNPMIINQRLRLLFNFSNHLEERIKDIELKCGIKPSEEFSQPQNSGIKPIKISTPEMKNKKAIAHNDLIDQDIDKIEINRGDGKSDRFESKTEALKFAKDNLIDLDLDLELNLTQMTAKIEEAEKVVVVTGEAPVEIPPVTPEVVNEPEQNNDAPPEPVVNETTNKPEETVVTPEVVNEPISDTQASVTEDVNTFDIPAFENAGEAIEYAKSMGLTPHHKSGVESVTEMIKEKMIKEKLSAES